MKVNMSQELLKQAEDIVYIETKAWSSQWVLKGSPQLKRMRQGSNIKNLMKEHYLEVMEHSIWR